MKLLQNKEIKRLFIICIVFVIIFTILMAVITKRQIDSNKSNVNNVIVNIVGVVKNKYPDVDEKEIIDILNNAENKKLGTENLRRYGINEHAYAILNMKEQAKNMIITNCVIVILTDFSFILIFICYLKYRQKKIDDLTMYIQKLSNKDYSLDISESAEGELNSLKSELYKITVMLKETADNSQAQKEALSNSVSDISHQLKTPLTSILILLDNLNESEHMDDATRKAFLLEITRQIKEMNFLIISLLQLSRLDVGVVEFENANIDVFQLLDEIRINLGLIAEVRNINLQINEGKEIFINGDYNWNREAIQNIIKNAIEHAKTKVIVNATQNSVYTKIEIQDDGDGIDEKDIKHIFDRFFKAKNSSENSIGIGLSLSKSIIEKQNGYITVDSKLGEGTIFTIKYMKTFKDGSV